MMFLKKYKAKSLSSEIVDKNSTYKNSKYSVPLCLRGKILMLVTKRQYRGAEVFAANLSSELMKLGQEIVFAGLYEPGKPELCIEGAKNLDLGKKSKFPINIMLCRKIAKMVKDEKPDVIQANGSDTLKHAIIAKKLYGFKTPIFYRNISVISTWVGGNPLKKVFNKWLFSNVDFVTSVGKKPLDDLIHTFQYPPKKTAVIARGIPVENYDKHQSRVMIQEELGIDDNYPIIMHIGKFSPEKNHAFLIDVAHKLYLEGCKFHLVCIGDGPEKPKVEGLIKDNSLDNVVHLVGFKNPVQKWLAGADLFVLCSLVEGVPGVILEAGSQKVPSIAVNVGGVGEIIEDGKTGFLIDGHDSDRFSDKIMKVLNDEALRNTVGESMYQLVTESYDPEVNARKFLELTTESQRHRDL